MIGIISYILHFLNEKMIRHLDSRDPRIESNTNTIIREFLHLRIHKRFEYQLYNSILIMNEGNINMI